jgi:hypothetical protein
MRHDQKKNNPKSDYFLTIIKDESRRPKWQEGLAPFNSSLNEPFSTKKNTPARPYAR